MGKVKNRPASLTNAVEMVKMNAPSRKEPLRVELFRTGTFFFFDLDYFIVAQNAGKVNRFGRIGPRPARLKTAKKGASRRKLP